MSGSGDPAVMTATAVPTSCPPPCSWGSRTSRSRTGPRPSPGPGELLLEVSHCGICGSDLHFLVEWGGRDERDRGPRVLGHGRRARRRRDRLERSATGSSPGQSPKCGECEYCLAGPAVALRRAGPGRRRRQATGRARSRGYKIDRRGARRCASPTTSRSSTPRSSSRSRSRCTASRRPAAPGPARAGSSPAAARSASCRSPRSRRSASTTSS